MVIHLSVSPIIDSWSVQDVPCLIPSLRLTSWVDRYIDGYCCKCYCFFFLKAGSQRDRSHSVMFACLLLMTWRRRLARETRWRWVPVRLQIYSNTGLISQRNMSTPDWVSDLLEGERAGTLWLVARESAHDEGRREYTAAILCMSFHFLVFQHLSFLLELPLSLLSVLCHWVRSLWCYVQRNRHVWAFAAGES